MSNNTANLELFKYDAEADKKEKFNITKALNNNFDKIDEFAAAIKLLIAQKATTSLDNLDEAGEAKFNNLLSAINALTDTVNGKLSASVLKAANGYIKFNNSVCLQWGCGEITIPQKSTIYSTNITLPLAYNDFAIPIISRAPQDNWGQIHATAILASNTTLRAYFYAHSDIAANSKQSYYWLTVGC